MNNSLIQILCCYTCKIDITYIQHFSYTCQLCSRNTCYCSTCRNVLSIVFFDKYFKCASCNTTVNSTSLVMKTPMPLNSINTLNNNMNQINLDQQQSYNQYIDPNCNTYYDLTKMSYTNKPLNNRIIRDNRKVVIDQIEKEKDLDFFNHETQSSEKLDWSNLVNANNLSQTNLYNTNLSHLSSQNLNNSISLGDNVIFKPSKKNIYESPPKKTNREKTPEKKNKIDFKSGLIDSNDCNKSYIKTPEKEYYYKSGEKEDSLYLGSKKTLISQDSYIKETVNSIGLGNKFMNIQNSNDNHRNNYSLLANSKRLPIEKLLSSKSNLHNQDSITGSFVNLSKTRPTREVSIGSKIFSIEVNFEGYNRSSKRSITPNRKNN